MSASLQHKQHIAERISHNNCPECRADCSRRFAGVTPFRYDFVHEYLSWVQPRILAIQNGENSVNARIWQREFVSALHTRVSSHFPKQNGRKFAPDYAKYHLATYGNDWHYLHN